MTDFTSPVCSLLVPGAQLQMAFLQLHQTESNLQQSTWFQLSTDQYKIRFDLAPVGNLQCQLIACHDLDADAEHFGCLRQIDLQKDLAVKLVGHRRIGLG